MTSRKKDIAEHLMERMRLIGHVMNHAHGPPARGWQGDFGPVYDRAEDFPEDHWKHLRA